MCEGAPSASVSAVTGSAAVCGVSAAAALCFPLRLLRKLATQRSFKEEGGEEAGGVGTEGRQNNTSGSAANEPAHVPLCTHRENSCMP